MEPPKKEETPDLAAYIGVAIVEWFKRYGEKDAAGRPVADTARTLVALADTAGEVISRLPTRKERRLARAGFELRFATRRRNATGD